MSEDKKRYTVSLAQEVARKFEDLAKESGMSKSALLTLFVNEKYDEKFLGREAEQKK